MNLVEVKNNQVVTSSRQVAEHFSKQHRNVIRAIQNLVEGVLKIEHTPQMFFLTSYTNEQNGQTYPEYYMNRDGFSLLVMGFTGQKAIEWKIKYIQAFNQMEQALKERQIAAPAPATVSIPPRVTYRGELLMTAVHLHKLMKMSNATLQVRAKKHNLRYIRLVTDELRAFKKENHRLNCAACVVLYPKDTVVALLKQFNQYEALLPVIHEYFKTTVPAPVSPSVPITLDALAIDNTVKDLSQKADTLSGLLKNLNSYRRTKESHAEYMSITLEFAASLFSELSKIKRKVEAMNA